MGFVGTAEGRFRLIADREAHLAARESFRRTSDACGNAMPPRCDLWHLPSSADKRSLWATMTKKAFAMLFGRTLGSSGRRRKWRLYRFIRLRLLRAVRSARD